jgi:hypothetical protein
VSASDVCAENYCLLLELLLNTNYINYHCMIDNNFGNFFRTFCYLLPYSITLNFIWLPNLCFWVNLKNTSCALYYLSRFYYYVQAHWERGQPGRRPGAHEFRGPTSQTRKKTRVYLEQGKQNNMYAFANMWMTISCSGYKILHIEVAPSFRKEPTNDLHRALMMYNNFLLRCMGHWTMYIYLVIFDL